MSDSGAVCLRGVSVRFQVGEQTVHALERVSLDIERGTSLAIVGRSGSGKSTLISVLALLRQPTEGSVEVDGRETSALSDAELARVRATRIGTVFQSFHLDPGFSAEENVRLPWHFASRTSARKSRKRAQELLELMGIPDLAQRQPGQMSGGQRQRVAIARALFMRPALLIADEPTGNLDEATASQIADVIFGLPEQMGTAVVVVTHDSEVASRAACQATIAQGRLHVGSGWSSPDASGAATVPTFSKPAEEVGRVR